MISLWRICEIVTMELATLQAVLTLQKDFYEHWGRWPTAVEIQQQLVGGR